MLQKVMSSSPYLFRDLVRGGWQSGKVGKCDPETESRCVCIVDYYLSTGLGPYLSANAIGREKSGKGGISG